MTFFYVAFYWFAVKNKTFRIKRISFLAYGMGGYIIFSGELRRNILVASSSAVHRSDVACNCSNAIGICGFIFFAGRQL
jgi:hypothetical protein